MLRLGKLLAIALAILSVTAVSAHAQNAHPSKPDANTSGTASASGSTFTAQEAKELVTYHNMARKEVGVGDVKWSTTVAKSAQNWADEIARTGEFTHGSKDSKGFGQNLSMGMGDDYGVKAAEKQWYSEKNNFPPGTPYTVEGSKTNGHYNQMIWAATTEIGAGKATILTGAHKGWTVIVCEYNPAGNLLGKDPRTAK